MPRERRDCHYPPASDALTPEECTLLGHMLFAAYHYGARTVGVVDREIDASIGRLTDTAATYRAKGLSAQAAGVQTRIDALVALRGKLGRRRAAVKAMAS
jgi:hypothetical protein